MARTRIAIGETIEERKRRKRRETAQRIRMLTVIAIVAVIARLVVKDPVKPTPIPHDNVPIKIMPGMLAALPPAERARLDPQLVAKLMVADEEARRNKFKKQQEIAAASSASGPYRPTARPEGSEPTEEKVKQQLYAYAKREQAVEKVKEEVKKEEHSRTKTLVHLANGRHIRVENAKRDSDGVTIRMAGVAATLPSGMVASVDNDAADWQEPVPAGQVILKPAHGITVVLDADTAARVTVKKRAYDEI